MDALQVKTSLNSRKKVSSFSKTKLPKRAKYNTEKTKTVNLNKIKFSQDSAAAKDENGPDLLSKVLKSPEKIKNSGHKEIKSNKNGKRAKQSGSKSETFKFSDHQT